MRLRLIWTNDVANHREFGNEVVGVIVGAKDFTGIPLDLERQIVNLLVKFSALPPSYFHSDELDFMRSEVENMYHEYREACWPSNEEHRLIAQWSRTAHAQRTGLPPRNLEDWKLERWRLHQAIRWDAIGRPEN